LSEGPRVIPLERHIDDRGYLYEIIHATDEFLPQFGQTYIVCSPVRNTIRGFHKHNVLWDYFCVARGAGKFVVARAPDDSVTGASASGQVVKPESIETFILSDRKPSLLVIPPNHWHGWMALEDETLVVSTGSEVYNRANPDELRVSPDVFGDVWAVKGR
jgi:dTDP-4-dehydrorhamnose 3,5-epimerase-like enzyme